MNSNSDQNNQGQFGRARMLWPLLLLLLLPWILNYMFGGNESTPGVTYTMFREQLEQGNIERVELAGERVTGVFREPVLLDRLNSEPIDTCRPSKIPACWRKCATAAYSLIPARPTRSPGPR
jgi:hypothetical protein